jgi:hypothetical protein
MSEFQGFYVRRCAGEDWLWTVGFDYPGTGEWEPESDHGSEREAKVRAWGLNGVECRYAYRRSEPGLWTVGDCGGGYWDPVSDHDSGHEASETVKRLNA